MPKKKLAYFSYISPAKVNQLYDQLTDFAVNKKTVKRGKESEGQAAAQAGGDAFFGFLKAGLSFGARGRLHTDIEEEGAETLVQKLTKVVNYISKHEKVLDLNELSTKKEGVPLDAFCYIYKGQFYVLGEFGRKDTSSITINGSAFSRSKGEILISKELLIEPGRKDNALKQKSYNDGNLVSDICIIVSEVGEYDLQLACSFKYFSDMGSNWDEHNKEVVVHPHSGNYHFFEGAGDTWFESLIFINGMRNNTIVGTPLFLIHSTDPKLVI
jgi:hypothetical protein